MIKLTFRRHPRVTGPARGASFGSEVDIKHKRGKIGGIRPPHWSDKGDDHGWKVWFVVKSDTAPGWRTVSFKARFRSEQDARVYAQDNVERIDRAYGLHRLD